LSSCGEFFSKINKTLLATFKKLGLILKINSRLWWQQVFDVNVESFLGQIFEELFQQMQ